MHLCHTEVAHEQATLYVDLHVNFNSYNDFINVKLKAVVNVIACVVVFS
jgi:hypothetical protein